MEPREISDALRALGGIELKLTVYRQISSSRDCLSGEGARRFGGRWNPPGSFPAIYTSFDLATAGAELRRFMVRQGRLLKDLLPRRVCEIELELAKVVDLRTKEGLAKVGLDLNLVRGDDLERCQAVGHAANRLGCEGLVAPSATGLGENLVISEQNLELGSSIAVIRS